MIDEFMQIADISKGMKNNNMISVRNKQSL